MGQMFVFDGLDGLMSGEGKCPVTWSAGMERRRTSKLYGDVGDVYSAHYHQSCSSSWWHYSRPARFARCCSIKSHHTQHGEVANTQSHCIWTFRQLFYFCNRMRNCTWIFSDAIKRILLLLHLFDGLFSRTTWVSRYHKSKTIPRYWDTVTSAGPYANNLHLAPDL